MVLGSGTHGLDPRSLMSHKEASPEKGSREDRHSLFAGSWGSEKELRGRGASCLWPFCMESRRAAGGVAVNAHHHHPQKREQIQRRQVPVSDGRNTVP